MGMGDEFHRLNRRAGDRRRRRRLVRHEQRSGFDRRSPEGAAQAVVVFENALVRLRDRPATLRLLLFTVNALNMADFMLTLNILNVGGGEANPIMRSLYSMGPLWAGSFKVVAVLLATLLVWRCRCYRDALAAALVMVVIFGMVLAYHVLGRMVFG
jgi:Domain of unknown function (DUF5658)